MNFNPDPSKQAQEVIFLSKVKDKSQSVQQVLFQKHLEMYFDTKLNFQ